MPLVSDTQEWQDVANNRQGFTVSIWGNVLHRNDLRHQGPSGPSIHLCHRTQGRRLGHG